MSSPIFSSLTPWVVLPTVTYKLKSSIFEVGGDLQTPLGKVDGLLEETGQTDEIYSCIPARLHASTVETIIIIILTESAVHNLLHANSVLKALFFVCFFLLLFKLS